MSGRTLLAVGLLLGGTLAAAPASACGNDDRFACAPTPASTDAQTTKTSTVKKVQRSTKLRGSKKQLATKKTTRNAARARIIPTSSTAKSRSASAKRDDESARVTSRRAESTTKAEAVKQVEARTVMEPPVPAEPATITGTVPQVEIALHSEPSPTTAAPRYEIASAEPAPLISPPLSTGELMSPVPTAGATEIVRVAVVAEIRDTEQQATAAPILAHCILPLASW